MRKYRRLGLGFTVIGLYFLGFGAGDVHLGHPAGWAFISGGAALLVCGALLCA